MIIMRAGACLGAPTGPVKNPASQRGGRKGAGCQRNNLPVRRGTVIFSWHPLLWNPPLGKGPTSRKPRDAG